MIIMIIILIVTTLLNDCYIVELNKRICNQLRSCMKHDVVITTQRSV